MVVSGITASVIFNRLYRFGPTQFISGAMILLAISLTFMLASASYTATMFTLAFIWGIGISCIGLALQMRVLQLAPDATDVASSYLSPVFSMRVLVQAHCLVTKSLAMLVLNILDLAVQH